MDREDLHAVMKAMGVDLWTLIESAITLAASDHGAELRQRRDAFVERLYAPPPQDPCLQIEEEFEEEEEEEKVRSGAREEEKGSSSPIEKVSGSSPLTPQSNHREEIGEEEEEEEEEEYEPLDGVDQQKRRIFAIKKALDDPDQSDEGIVDLLQNLADMDITFKALQATDIGRHVNGLRKHPSAEVRGLVKQLVRKWKEIVDEWVKASGNSSSPAIVTDGDSPQQIPAKSSQNGHKIPNFGYSPSPQSGRMSSTPNRSSFETSEAKPKAIPKREAPSRPIHSAPSSATSSKLKEEEKDSFHDARLANAKKRLHENYQEAQNAKKDSSDGHQRDPETEKFVFRAEQRRAPPGEALVIRSPAGLLTSAVIYDLLKKKETKKKRERDKFIGSF